MITLMNKTRKTASSPSRGNRLSSASLTSSDGRRSSLSAGSSRHGGHEYMMPSSLGRFQKPVPYCLPCFLKEHHEDDEEKFNHKFLLAVNTLPPVEGGTTAVIPLPSATSPGRAASPQPLLLEDGSSLEGSLEEQSSDITIPITMTAMVPYGGKPSTANSTASSVVAAAATSLLPHSNLLYLKCCMCDRPATRKCQGLLHDEDINSLLAQLKKCPKSEWKKVIKPFTSLTSEKKLLLLIEQIIQQDDSEEVTTDLHDDSSHHSDPYRVKAGGDNHSVHSRDTTSSSYYNTLSPNQLQQIKYALEKLRHECDECYCTSCYQIVHSGGKRQYHTWKGFQEYARVCSVCQANPSELSCLDCISAVTQHLPPSMDSTKAANQLLGNHLNDNGMMMSVRDNKRGVDYCTACFHVYHTIGRKKRHRKEVVYEKYANDPNYYFDGLDMIKEEDEQGEITLNQDIPADDYCTLCLRRLGKKCQHDECQTIVCDECFEFKHKKRCKHRPHTLVTQGGSSRKLTLSPSSRNLYGGDGDVKADQGMSKSMGAKNSKKIGDKTVEEQICVVCGEIADKKCVQCGDFYCSRVWMGNPGCFIQYHSKGNRATHQTQSLSEANQKTFISFSSLLEQGKLNIKPGKSFNLNN